MRSASGPHRVLKYSLRKPRVWASVFTAVVAARTNTAQRRAVAMATEGKK